MDFYKIRERQTNKRGVVDIYPDFLIGKFSDLMIRGKTVYAVWDEDAGLWSTNEYDVARLVDKDIYAYKENRANPLEDRLVLRLMSDYSTGSWDQFKRYVSRIADSYHQLDDKICFENTPVTKKDYISKRLPYSMAAGDCPAYEELISTLYDPEEREKLEWSIGAIISGDAKKIQKFLVLYGDAGSGKSTILNIIQKLFVGYYTTFDAKELTSTNNAFATDAFSNNPLVAIQHDGDLSDIRDNSKLNSIVSHEEIIVNEKFKARYSTKSNCFLYMATNKPVKITDGKSGIIRRLIDVRPSGRKLEPNRYNQLFAQVDFELGAIAQHCLDIYNKLGKNYYNSYKPLDMMYKTDPFFNFVEDHYLLFKEDDCTSLKAAYAMYKEYNKESGNEYQMQMYKFREELKNYFKFFYDEHRDEDGTRVRSYYEGFLAEKFESKAPKAEPKVEKTNDILVLNKTKSLFDEMYKDQPAQYANEFGAPMYKWDDVKTTLKDIDTSREHYVLMPDEHVVVDFDFKDEKGNKDAKRNLEEASKWPATYTEFSKSGGGVHLSYIYSGDVTQLSRIFADSIEIKVFTGKSSLRRKLSKCNDIPIATISSGLPLKERKGDKVLNFEAVKSEKGLRKMIIKNLNKECHPATKPSIDFIYKILSDAYESGLHYDISDMEPAIIAFAANSSNQSDYCLKMVGNMKFKSEQPSESGEYSDSDDIVFYDVEVFPNLFIVNFKHIGEDKKVVRLINPTPRQIEDLLKFKLVGFNCRRYDNHILYARMLGYSNEELFKLSTKIVNDKSGSNVLFGEAYNISYTDVYDYAAKKQSLKKWEIELHIHHQELGLPWDQPVPEELWEKVAEYCDNDVIATEAVWNATQGDFLARKILAKIAGGIVNDTTNTLTTKLIFGKNRTPQDEFEYRDLSKPVKELRKSMEAFLRRYFPKMLDYWKNKGSCLPFFEGYKFENGKSTYKGYEVGEGGMVWSKPGMYGRTKTFDVASMHPHSAMAEYLFGTFTQIFHDLVQARIYIKHKDFESAGKLFDGKLAEYCTDKDMAKALSGALKIAINSVYGLTAAKFMNAFRDIRNKDNIVAKRGALTMIDLKEAVEARGGKVIHIKTDSIKVVDPTPELEKFIIEFGEWYGYSFEVEHIFEKICLVNDAVYVAKLAEDDDEWMNARDKAIAEGKDIPTRWTATGTQFAVPYVFKTLFSREKIEFSDLCETKSVSSSLYLDMNETLPDVTDAEKAFDKAESMYKKGQLSDISFEQKCAELQPEIDIGHDYRFVGKVGLFCPVKPGCGGGLLVRDNHGNFAAATGSKNYRWLESEMVEKSGSFDIIDRSYYKALVDDAVETIKQYGDIEGFVA